MIGFIERWKSTTKINKFPIYSRKDSEEVRKMENKEKVVGPGGFEPPLAEKLEEMELRLRKLEKFVLILREATLRDKIEYDEADFA